MRKCIVLFILLFFGGSVESAVRIPPRKERLNSSMIVKIKVIGALFTIKANGGPVILYGDVAKYMYWLVMTKPRVYPHLRCAWGECKWWPNGLLVWSQKKTPVNQWSGTTKATWFPSMKFIDPDSRQVRYSLVF